MVTSDSAERRRPYAATANVMAVLARARARNLPEVISNDFLRIAGIPGVVFGRVTEALEFLDFINDDGSPTDKLKALAAAPEAEYRTILGDAIREAYREDFKNVSPAEDAQEQIIDAFRRYEPRSQTARMVMLFLGLCRESGMPVRDVPRERKMQPAHRRQSRRGYPAAVSRSGAGGAERDRSAQLSGLLFGVTEDDIAALGEEDFNEVWTALGKVARARAQARQRLIEAPGSEDDAGGEEEGEAQS